ncbi:hypothetical protein TPAU25S_00621 [Tsukamurella paurometabola]|nr:Uncharacterised protein [Tsukamurella paurometabola]
MTSSVQGHDLIEREFVYTPASIGCSVHCLVMHHDKVPVCSNPEVNLDPIDAEFG